MGISLGCEPCSKARHDGGSEGEPLCGNGDEYDIPPSDSTLANASEEEAREAAELLAAVRADSKLLAAVERHRGGESLEALCTRFALARPRSLARALAMLSADMKYRDEHDMLGLAATQARDVLMGSTPISNLDPADVEVEHFKQFPHGFIGRDRMGRLVMYKNYGNVRFWELAKLGIEVQALARYHLWLQERALRAMGHQGQWVCILDLEGCTLAQCVAKAHLRYAKELSGLDSLLYPERLGAMYIINAPTVFEGPWRVVRSLLDAKSLQKVHVLGGPDKWRQPLSETLDLRILPKSLGGETVLSLPSFGPCARERAEAQIAMSPPCGEKPVARKAQTVSLHLIVLFISWLLVMSGLVLL